MENQVQIFKNEEFGEVRTLSIENNPYFVANDMAKALGYTNPSKATNDHCKNMIFRWGNDKMGRRQKFKLIPESDVVLLLTKCTTLTQKCKESFIKFLQDKNILLNNTIVLTSRKEIEFVDMLEKVLEPFGYECIKQYLVLDKYKIDFYIKDIKVAIEYDENNHKDYSVDEEIERQSRIEKELGCTFIRVSDKDNDLWNIGYIMKELNSRGVK